MRLLLPLRSKDGLVVGGLTVYGLANLCFGALSAGGPHSPAPLYGALSGVFGAQLALIAIWSVLGTSGYSRRAVLLLVACLFLLTTLAVGCGALAPIAGHNRNWNAAWSTAFRLPMFLIAFQLPFWMTRLWFAWRIVLREAAHDISDERIRIRDLMVGTAVIASCLGAARLAAPSTSSSANYLISCILNVLFLAAFSFCCIMPAVVATLRARLVWLAVPAAFGLGCAAIATFLGYIIMTENNVVFPTSPEFYWLCASICGFSLALIATLLLAKWLGYVLVWGTEVRASALQAGGVDR